MKKNFRYNKTIYNRAKHSDEEHFTIISNTIVKDIRLNFTEKGLMLYLLSNSDEFVVNKSVIIKTSGLGRKAIDNAFTKLKELNYIQYFYKNNIHTWIINESPEYCPKSNTTKVTSQKYNHSSDSTIVTLPLEQVINTKEKRTEEKNTKKENNHVENNNEMQTLDSKDFSLSLSDKNEVNSSLNNNLNNNVNNDLNLILSKSKHFNSIYTESGNGWDKLDISKYSNSQIAHHTIEKEKGNNDSKVGSKKIILFSYLVRYSSTIEDSNLWKEFKHQCNLEYHYEILKRLDMKND